jgi:hypothetical protein
MIVVFNALHFFLWGYHYHIVHLLRAYFRATFFPVICFLFDDDQSCFDMRVLTWTLSKSH